MVLRLCFTVESSNSQVRNIFPHIALHELPIFCHSVITCCTFSLSTSQTYVVQKRCWFLQINAFHRNFPSRAQFFSDFPTSLISSTYTDRNNPLARLTNKHPQLKTFSHPRPKRTSSNYLHLCFGRRIHISGHSDFRIFKNVGASSILTCVFKRILHLLLDLNILGKLDMISMTLAAVICDAGDPCSVNTAHEPEIIFHNATLEYDPASMAHYSLVHQLIPMPQA